MLPASVSLVDWGIMGASAQSSDDGEMGAAATEGPLAMTDEMGSSIMMDRAGALVSKLSSFFGGIVRGRYVIVLTRHCKMCKFYLLPRLE